MGDVNGPMKGVLKYTGLVKIRMRALMGTSRIVLHAAGGKQPQYRVSKVKQLKQIEFIYKYIFFFFEFRENIFFSLYQTLHR